MSGISLVSAPSVSLQSVSISAPSVKVSSIASGVINTQSAPNLSLSSLGSVSTSNINIGSGISTPNLSGIGSSMGTQAANALSKSTGIPTSLPPPGEALNTLGFQPITAGNLSSLTGNISIPALPNLEFPKLPEFPGIDMAGINLGAGPKFIGEQIAKYKTMVPPFAPGLKINMGMALAAISVLKAAMSANPSELLKHLLSSVVDDLKSQAADQLKGALDSSGVNGVKDQISGVQGQISGVVNGAQDSFVQQFNRENPEQTVTSDTGETTVIPPPKPDLSLYQGFQSASNIGQGVLAQTSTNVSQFSSNVGSGVRSLSYPPNG